MELKNLLKEKNELEFALINIENEIKIYDEKLKLVSERYYSNLAQDNGLTDFLPIPIYIHFIKMKEYYHKIESLKDTKYKCKEELKIIKDKIKNYSKNDEKNFTDVPTKKIEIVATKRISKDNEILYPEFEEIYDELKKYPFKKFSEVTKDYYYKKSKNGKRYLDNNNEIKLRNYRERVRRYKEGKPYKEYLRNHSQVEHYDKKKHLMKINKSKTKSNH